MMRRVQWIILLFEQEDQNKSSANLFSGLESGGWCKENFQWQQPGDLDQWIAVKCYPFMILSFSTKMYLYTPGNNLEGEDLINIPYYV